MDLLATTYHNIWPFREAPLSLCFHEGNHLIRSPIGKGKSFLFFDGPVFALYKYSTRPMVHRKEKKGKVSLLFRHDGLVWLVSRQITLTKSGGESVASRLYRIDLPDDRESMCGFESGCILYTDTDIEPTLLSYAEEIIFSNQKELDNHLQDLLPPREVAMSIYFLMQDAPNVFELAPAERVQVFKHLFGLIGIDHAKELIRDERKKTQMMISLQQDDTLLTGKFETHIDDIKKHISRVTTLSLDETGREHIERLLAVPLFHDIWLLENIQLQEIDLRIDEELFTQVLEYADTRLKQIEQLQGKQAQLDTQLAQRQKEKQQLLDTQKAKTQEQQQVQTALAAIDVKALKDLQQQKLKYLDEQNTLSGEQYLEILRGFGYEVTDMPGAMRTVDQLLAEGKTLAAEKEQVTVRITHHEQQQKDLQERKVRLEKQLKELDIKYDDQKRFHCDKIEGDCPYVELIKGASLQTLWWQKKILEEEYASCVAWLKKEVDPALLVEQKRLADRISELRIQFQSLDRKSMQESYAQYTALTQKIQQIDQRSWQLEKEQEQVRTYESKLTELTTTIKHIQDQLVWLEEKYTTAHSEKTSYTQQIDTVSHQDLTELRTILLSIQHLLEQLRWLVTSYIEKTTTYQERRRESEIIKISLWYI